MAQYALMARMSETSRKHPSEHRSGWFRRVWTSKFAHGSGLRSKVETVLFNESIAYNLHYGRDGATQQDIEEAAKAARIYDRILSFPDGKPSCQRQAVADC